MTGDLQPELDGAGREDELLQIRSLALPAEAADLAASQPAHAPPRLGKNRVRFLGARFDHRVRKALSQRGRTSPDSFSGGRQDSKRAENA